MIFLQGGDVTKEYTIDFIEVLTTLTMYYM